GALHPRARADRRPAGLRKDAGASGPALRQRYRVQLSGAGVEAVQALPQLSDRKPARSNSADERENLVAYRRKRRFVPTGRRRIGLGGPMRALVLCFAVVVTAAVLIAAS